MSKTVYESDALVSALSLVRTLAGADAAELIAALIAARKGSRKRSLEIPLTAFTKRPPAITEWLTPV